MVPFGGAEVSLKNALRFANYCPRIMTVTIKLSIVQLQSYDVSNCRAFIRLATESFKPYYIKGTFYMSKMYFICDLESNFRGKIVNHWSKICAQTHV